MNKRLRLHSIAALSLFLAFVVAAWPLPEWLQPWQPQWVVIVLIYWGLLHAGQVGFGLVWAFGLLNDYFTGSYLGTHVVSYSLLIFLCAHLHRLVQISNIIQHTILISFLVVGHLLCLTLITFMTADHDLQWLDWATLPTSILLWPLVFEALQAVQRRLRTTDY